jgi:hypothetical protein
LALTGDSLHVGSLAALRSRTAGLCAGIAAATVSMIDIGNGVGRSTSTATLRRGDLSSAPLLLLLRP